MVAAARYCVVYVRNKFTALIVPGAVIFKKCEIPKDALWAQRQGIVPFAVAECDVRNRCINLDEHHSSIDGSVWVSIIAGSVQEATVGLGGPYRHHIVKGGKRDGGDKGIENIAVRNVYDNAVVQVCGVRVIEDGSFEQCPLRLYLERPV